MKLQGGIHLQGRTGAADSMANCGSSVGPEQIVTPSVARYHLWNTVSAMPAGVMPWGQWKSPHTLSLPPILRVGISPPRPL
jgi:hypothetical protein